MDFRAKVVEWNGGRWRGAKAKLHRALGYSEAYVGRLVEGKVPLTEESEIKLAALFDMPRPAVAAMFRKPPPLPETASTVRDGAPVFDCPGDCKRMMVSVRHDMAAMEARIVALERVCGRKSRPGSGVKKNLPQSGIGTPKSR